MRNQRRREGVSASSAVLNIMVFNPIRVMVGIYNLQVNLGRQIFL